MPSNATNRREQLKRQQEAAARQKRTFRIVGVAAGILALVLVGVLLFVFVSGAQRSPAPAAAQVVPAIASADRNALVVGEGRPGTPTVTLYLDYQCPNCKVFEQNYGAMLEETAAAGDWTLQYKTMTFMDTNLSNTASTRAALGAACSATDVGTYSGYNTAVYANQAAVEVRGSEGFSDQLLRDTIPASVGITGDSLTTFQACYDGKATQDFVDAVDKSAYDDGVTGTPTLAVNGKPLDLGQVSDLSPAGVKQFILANA